MQGICAPSIQGRVMRASRLDSCGNYTESDSNAVVVSDGFVKIGFKPQYDAGTEIVKKNANGDLCVNEKSEPLFKRFELDIEFCQVSPVLHDLLVPGRLLTSGVTPVTGTGQAFGEGQDDKLFALEVWSLAAGQAACAGGLAQYIRWLIPWVYHGEMQDFEIENNDLSFKMKAETHRAGSDFIAGGIETSMVLLSNEHLAYQFTSAAPPTASCASSTSPS